MLVFFETTACWMSFRSSITLDLLFTEYHSWCASIMSRPAGEHCPMTRANNFCSSFFRLALSFLYLAKSNFHTSKTNLVLVRVTWRHGLDQFRELNQASAKFSAFVKYVLSFGKFHLVSPNHHQRVRGDRKIVQCGFIASISME